MERSIEVFEEIWGDEENRLKMVPGKEALAAVNQHLQGTYGISVTPTSIIGAMTTEEPPKEMVELVHQLSDFGKLRI